MHATYIHTHTRRALRKTTKYEAFDPTARQWPTVIGAIHVNHLNGLPFGACVCVSVAVSYLCSGRSNTYKIRTHTHTLIYIKRTVNVRSHSFFFAGDNSAYSTRHAEYCVC